jgi:hypothetical protein
MWKERQGELRRMKKEGERWAAWKEKEEQERREREEERAKI